MFESSPKYTVNLPVVRHFVNSTAVRRSVLKTAVACFHVVVAPFFVVVMVPGTAFSEKHETAQPEQPIRTMNE